MLFFQLRETFSFRCFVYPFGVSNDKWHEIRQCQSQTVLLLPRKLFSAFAPSFSRISTKLTTSMSAMATVLWCEPAHMWTTRACFVEIIFDSRAFLLIIRFVSIFPPSTASSLSIYMKCRRRAPGIDSSFSLFFVSSNKQFFSYKWRLMSRSSHFHWFRRGIQRKVFQRNTISFCRRQRNEKRKNANISRMSFESINLPAISDCFEDVNHSTSSHTDRVFKRHLRLHRRWRNQQEIFNSTLSSRNFTVELSVRYYRNSSNDKRTNFRQSENVTRQTNVSFLILEKNNYSKSFFLSFFSAVFLCRFSWFECRKMISIWNFSLYDETNDFEWRLTLSPSCTLSPNLKS